MKRLLLVAQLSTGLMGGQAVAADWSDAYSRQDFKLGLSIQAFLEKPYPHLDEETGVSAVCSNDPRATDVRYETAQLDDDKFAAASGVKCGYYFTDPDLPQVQMDAGIKLLDQMVPTKFYFLPDESKELRLARIDTIVPLDLLPRLLPAMEIAYGSKPELKTLELQNGFGARFTATTYIWSNASSEAKVHDFAGREGYIYLEHSLKSLIAEIANLPDPRASSDAGKL